MAVKYDLSASVLSAAYCISVLISYNKFHIAVVALVGLTFFTGVMYLFCVTRFLEALENREDKKADFFHVTNIVLLSVHYVSFAISILVLVITNGVK